LNLKSLSEIVDSGLQKLVKFNKNISENVEKMISFIDKILGYVDLSKFNLGDQMKKAFDWIKYLITDKIEEAFEFLEVYFREKV
jgi:hypothetical protein